MSQYSNSQKRMPVTLAERAQEISRDRTNAIGITEKARALPRALRAIDSSPASSVLSEREHEVIAWVAQGRNNVEIAVLLAISPFTVKNHVQRIIRKLGASNRTEAAVQYLHGNARRMRRRSTDREGSQVSESTETPA